MKAGTRVYDRRGATTVQLDAVHRPDGSLAIEGYDCGEAPMDAYGQEDLEYELVIPAGEVQKAVCAILRDYLASTGTPITALRECLDAAKVKHKFRVIPG